MKNFIELYKVLRDHTDMETLSFLVEDYQQEIVDTVMEIKHNNTTRKLAVDSYKKICLASGVKQDIENGIMCEGHSAVSLAVKSPKYNEECPAFKFLLETVKSDKRPVCLKDSIDYSIATAKVNGWKMGDTDFFIRIGENKYNLSLVARIFNMIADPKNYNDCDLFIANGNILMLRTQYGFGIVLPFVSNNPGFYDVTPGDNSFVDMIKADFDKAVKEVA